MRVLSVARRAAPLALALLVCAGCDDAKVVDAKRLTTKTVKASAKAKALPHDVEARFAQPEESTPAQEAHAQAQIAALLSADAANVAGATGTGKAGTRGRGSGVQTQGASSIGDALRTGGLGTRGVGAGGGGSASVSGLMGASGVGVGYGSGEGALGHKTDRDVTMSLGGGASRMQPPPPPAAGGTFRHAGTNPVVSTREDALSTFAVDVDAGSWLYGKRFLQQGRAPHEGSVRVEEWVNAMHYDYRAPTDEAFAIHVDSAPSPFTRDHHVVRVALQGRRVSNSARKPAHVTFLVDVSGSMGSADKLPWARDAILVAVDAMRRDDTIAIATYAGDTRVLLPTTSATRKDAIAKAVATLVSGGGTNMGSGMELAYQEANKNLGSERSARVMVLSDGDANIGRTGHDAILASIRGYVSEGVTMSTVGFGTGNYNDHLMEQLANAGNGTYTYIGDRETMRRVFADELTQTLEVIAQDAKIQVEWNPETVSTYRLLGYENRDVADSDFRNDKKDAGEIGAGHAVTALYEVRVIGTGSLGTVRVRHKVPRHTKAGETARVMQAPDGALDADGQAALGMALAAEILRGSEHAAGLTLVDAAALLRKSAIGAHAKERRDAAELFERAPVRAVAAR